MALEELRSRKNQAIPEPNPDLGAGTAGKAEEPHPAGEVKHALWLQIVRMLLFASWFNGVCVVINVTQYLGSPLYLFSKKYYYSYMSLTKQSFAILITTVTQWFSPTLLRISWDPSLRGRFRRTKAGQLETDLPERLVLIANHQIYTDWIYLWWFSYTSHMHGHVFIILKESLKYIPIVGPGMMFFSFIFMARKWALDKTRMKHRLTKLMVRHDDSRSGSGSLDPMWLMIFPEGTNLSANTRKRSAKWAEHENIADLKYQLLPRSTGLQFCLNELKGTVEWVYDCTMAYEGTPPGGYAQDIFTLRSTYFQGRPPKSVNMYWRRFAVKDIPVSDQQAFEIWVLDRWKEKEQLLDHFYTTGRFPAGIAGAAVKGQSEDDYINTEVGLRAWYEIGQIFVILAAAALIVNIILKLAGRFV